MRRIYREGFDGRAAFRRDTVATPPRPVTQAAPEATIAAPARGAVTTFARRVARAVYRRAVPFLRPIAFRARRYFVAGQTEQWDSALDTLRTSTLSTATWAHEEQAKMTTRLLAETQASRRLIIDKGNAAAARQSAQLDTLARELSSIRRALPLIPGEGSLPSVLQATLVPGATYVHLGIDPPPSLASVIERVGSGGRVVLLGCNPASLDDVLAPSMNVNVLHLDVAGAEKAILRGAIRVLRENADVVLMVRFTRDALKRYDVSIQEWLSMFTESGFRSVQAALAGGFEPVSETGLDQVEFIDLLFFRPHGRHGTLFG